MANPIQSIGGAPAEPQVSVAGASKQSVMPAAQGAPDVATAQQAHDATDLSTLGSLIGTAARVATSQSSIRAGLVASLKAQIGAGAYHPDPDEVAVRVAAAIKA